MEAGLREVCRSVRIGKILIQRVRTNKICTQSVLVNGIGTGRRDRAAKVVLFKGCVLLN